MKKYTVYFYIKENRTEYLADVAVIANNAKDACKAVKPWFYGKTGKNAFRPATRVDAAARKWYEDRENIRHYPDVIGGIAQ